jgi:hypothetical protein
LPDHIVKIIEVEFLSGAGNIKAFYQAIKASHQGIALAIPQTLRNHMPL